MVSVRKRRDGSVARTRGKASEDQAFVEIVPREGERRRAESHPSPLIELDLPCGACLRFSTDVPVEHMASLAAALSSC